MPTKGSGAFFVLEGMMNRKLGVCAALLAWDASLVWAALFGTVRVTVRDPQNLAVPNAAVLVRDTASTWSRKAVTDAIGRASIEAVPIGRYLVSATAEGLGGG